MLLGGESHVEPSNNANATVPIPFVVLDAHLQRFEVTSELVPLPSIPISNSRSGIHSISLNYFDGALRYWFGPHRFAVGIGETLWNQQTEYLYVPVQYDASRGAGARYEAGVSLPLGHRNYVETILAASPSIHARLSYTFGSPGYAASPVSEEEAQTDIQAAFVAPARRWTLKYGVRYLNMTAKFDDGSFADANHVTGVFVTALYSVHP